MTTNSREAKPTPHKHAALIKQWADDPSVPVWMWFESYWERIRSPAWYEGQHYALGDKPTSPPKRMCVLAGVEFPAPETEVPPHCTIYYAVDIGTFECHFEYRWSDDKFDTYCLTNGLVHLTKEAAQQHAKALLAANKAAVTPKE